MSRFKISHRLFGLLFLLLLAANILVWREVASFQRSELKVVFFDVGQGDAILIETPERHLILIDGGPDDTILNKIDRWVPFWRRRLDLVVLTHPHADHFYGLAQVLDRYQVDRILWTGVADQELAGRLWAEALAQSSAEVVMAQAGQRIRSASTFLDVLYPLESYYRYLPRDQNDLSVVVRLAYGRHRWLLTGDATARTENDLMATWGGYLESQILKVAHHGSHLSSQEEFLDLVDPELAVIQVGADNRYGHPAEEVLDRLSERMITILRNDLDGDIKIISNGLTYYYE
ncbi:MAG TPA: MBL fold metallo-hydrolase [Candidatus Pacearchaeota archaeon]|nr:MBL fold metallo-hydrolase [Candidatus Pacearchaeota archaeon]